MEKTYTLVLKLTKKQIEYLRNSTSDLGMNDIDAIRLQAKIADAIIDCKENILHSSVKSNIDPHDPDGGCNDWADGTPFG